MRIHYLESQKNLDKQYLNMVLVHLHNSKEDARYYKQRASIEAMITKAVTVLFALGGVFGATL